MALLVELESAVTSPINTVWGATASWLFVVIFLKALYCTMQVTMNITAGKTAAVASLVIALSALIGCHMMLLPAAVATSRSVRLMGAVNEMRYIRAADGVKLAPDSLIIQAECLSTYKVCSRGKWRAMQPFSAPIAALLSPWVSQEHAAN